MTVAPPMGSIQGRRNPFAFTPALLGCYDLRDGHYTPAGAKVSALLDFSGNGNHWAQGTDANRWTYHAVGTAFACQTMKCAGSQVMTMAMAAQAAGITIGMAFSYAAQGTVLFETGSGADACGVYLDANPRVRGLYNRGAFTQHVTNGAGVRRAVLTFEPGVAAVDQVRAYNDDGTAGSAVTASASSGTIVSSTWTLGARTGPSFGATVELAALAVYSGILDTDGRTALRAALAGYA